MKYIKISNKGEIEPNAFKLIGASTKRSDNTKIGFFGSGLKYAMAFLLRENINFKIFSGEKEVVVSTKKVQHRGQDFDMIQINGEDTSMTTEMGPKWKHWGAVREIYCNAMDEGDDLISVVDLGEVVAVPENTTFYVELTGDLVQIVDNWDQYFSKERKDVVYNSTVGFDVGKIMWSRPDDNFVIYRRGIQCHMSPRQPSCFNYDFPWIDINESREINSMYFFKERLTQYFFKQANVNVVRILLEKLDKDMAHFEADLHWYDQNGMSISIWTEAIGNHIIVPKEIAGWYKTRIERDRSKFLLIPNDLATKIQKYLPDVTVLGDTVGGYKFQKVDETDKHKFLLGEVKRFFSETSYIVDYPINVVKFADTYVLGYAHEGNIYISDMVFEQGRRKLAEVIYEENEHLKTGYTDETRIFQNHLISQVISRMEEQHAFFL